MNPVVCAYCNKESRLVSGEFIYPHRPDLFKKKFYLCSPCNAYVGCHPGTENPLGRLANAELRRWKSNAHALFDPLWKNKAMSRSKAYKVLAEHLGISKRQCHIGMFDVAMCKQAIEACKIIRGL